MERNRAVVLVAALLAVALAAPLAAQSTTTGSVTGVVSDPEGGVLPGTTVTVKSEVLMGDRFVVTDEVGRYRFPSLPPGVYTVQAELAGFSTESREGVRVGLGQALEINLVMRIATVTEEIVVTAESPLVSTVANSVDANLDQDFLKAVPLPRNFNALMNYAPGVNAMNAYGSTSRATNAYLLDGVNVSNPGNGDYWILPSVDWIQEVQVGGLGANAEYGGFSAGVLNAVTKSGGNEFSGDITAYYTPDSFVSSNTDDPQDEFEYQDLSISLGGKIAADRLWYFLSGNVVRDTRTPFGAVDDQERSTDRALGKLTWQAGQRHRLAFLVDYDGIFTERRGIDAFTLPSGSQKQESPNYSYNASWEGLINDRNFLTAKLTGWTGEDDRLPYFGSNKPGREDADSLYLWDNEKYTRDYDYARQTLDFAWNLFADGVFGDDSHAFKFGVQYEDGEADEFRSRNGGFSWYDDSFYCDSLDDYFADPSCAIYSKDFGSEIRLAGRQTGLALYAQDSWKVSRLTINLGVRYGEYQGGFENARDDVYDVDFVDPRFGFVWDVSGNARTAVKGFYGRYHQGMFSYLYDREESGDVFTPFYYCDYDFGDEDFTDCSTPSLQAARMDGGINHPYTDQYVATFEQQLGKDTSVGLDYVVRRTRDIVAMVNANDDYDNLVAPDNPLTGGSLPFYDLLSEPDFVLTNPSAAYQDYDAFMLRFDKRYSQGWLLRASLVYADLEGNVLAADGYVPEFEDLNGQTNAEGKLRNYSQLEGKVYAAVDLPLGFQIAGSYTFLSGEYWTPFANVRGLYFNDPQSVNLVARGSEQLPDRSLVDLRLSWTARLGGDLQLAVFLDGFNVFNEDTVLDVNERWGDYRYNFRNHPAGSTWRANAAYGDTTAIERPRELRLGLRFSF